MKHFFLPTVLFFLISFFVQCGQQEIQKAGAQLQILEYQRTPQQEKFIPFLNHENAAVRLLAVQALGRIQNPDAVVLLANRLKDTDPAVRAAAAFALGQLFNPVAEPYLLDALHNNEDELILANIIEALGKSGTQKSFKPLQDFLQGSRERLIQQAAIACGILAYRNFIPFSNAEVLATLLEKHPSPEVRWRAAYALYRIKSPDAYPALFKGLEDSDFRVKSFALRALADLLDLSGELQFRQIIKKKLLDELSAFWISPDLWDALERLSQDSSWYVRYYATDFTAELAEKISQKSLLNRARKVLDRGITDAHPHVRTAAVQGFRRLAKRDEAGVYKILRAIFQNNPDVHVRGEALISMAAINPAQTLLEIQGLLENRRWPDMYYTINALRQINDSRAARLLKSLADSQQISVSTLALEAYVNQASPWVDKDFLVEKLRAGDPALVTIISTYFANKKIVKKGLSPAARKQIDLLNESLVQELINLYRTYSAPRDMETMQAILVALDSLGNKNTRSFFRALLASPFKPIRTLAYQKLTAEGEKVPLPSDTTASALTKWNFDLSPAPHTRVVFETSRGDFTVELFPEKAPVTVKNFLTLVNEGFYENLYFHRVIPGFVIQGGDPRADGWGGPGYAIPCEYNDIFYGVGVMGMAHAGKDTGGSQFFITHLPQPHLNGRHTAFGSVVEGQAVVETIQPYDQIFKIRVLSN